MCIEDILTVQSIVSLNEICKNYGIPCVLTDLDYTYARTTLLNTFKETAEYGISVNVLETTLSYAKVLKDIDEEYHREYDKISQRMNDLACELNDIVRQINGGNDWVITE